MQTNSVLKTGGSSVAVLWWKGSSKIVLPLCCLQSHVLHLCFNAQPSNYKLNTFVSWLAYKWVWQDGCNYSYNIWKASMHTILYGFLDFNWCGERQDNIYSKCCFNISITYHHGQCDCYYHIYNFTNQHSTSRKQYDSYDISSCGVSCDYRHHHHDSHTNHHIHLVEKEPQEHSLSTVSCCEHQWWDSGATTECVLHDYQRRHKVRV